MIVRLYIAPTRTDQIRRQGIKDSPARRFRYTLEKMARAATSTVMYATGTISEVAILVVCFSCSLMQLYKMHLS